jgi:hypothetical protein
LCHVWNPLSRLFVLSEKLAQSDINFAKSKACSAFPLKPGEKSGPGLSYCSQGLPSVPSMVFTPMCMAALASMLALTGNVSLEAPVNFLRAQTFIGS